MSAAAVFFLVSASVALGSLAFQMARPRSFGPPPARPPHPVAAAKLAAQLPRAMPEPPCPQVDERCDGRSSRRPMDADEPRSPLRASRGAPPLLALHTLGRPTHAPEELFQRAGKLVTAGVDLVLTETSITDRSIKDIEREIAPSARILPTADGQGIQISSLSESSIARAAGLQRGDVVTAVNGYALSSPEALLDAYASVELRKAALLEVRRGARPVVLKVSFSR